MDLPVVTPEDVVHAAVPPETVSTWPVEPMPKRVALFVPLPTIRSPVVVIGDNALNAAEAVVCPVPPLLIAIVPELAVSANNVTTLDVFL